MDEIKRVLVALDLTEMDETLISYVTRLSNEVALDQVYFLNVMKSLEIPEKIMKKYPKLVAPMDEATSRQIQFTIDEVAGDQLKSEYEIMVTDGNAAEKILKWSKIKEIDLIVMGRKSGLEGEGIASRKVVRLSPCSVILVPEVLPDILRKIVVPIDYSPASRLAFEFALLIAAKIPGLQITCLNVYEVPSGYHTSGKSYEEFAEIMKANAEESFQEFIGGYDLEGVSINGKFELNESGTTEKKIYQFSLRERASAIAVGSKGRTQAAALLLGSVSEKLITLNSNMPQIVVKQRGRNMDFLEALLEI
jgi:nucleotide-binding universal stress UspA family protein